MKVYWKVHLHPMSTRSQRVLMKWDTMERVDSTRMVLRETLYCVSPHVPYACAVGDQSYRLTWQMLRPS